MPLKRGGVTAQRTSLRSGSCIAPACCVWRSGASESSIVPYRRAQLTGRLRPRPTESRVAYVAAVLRFAGFWGDMREGWRGDMRAILTADIAFIDDCLKKG